MTDFFHGLQAVVLIWGGAFLGLVVGATYFIRASGTAGTWSRLAASAFGPSLTLLFLVSVVWWPERHRYTSGGVQAFYWLQLVPFALLIILVARYPGPRRLHWALLPVGLLAWAWVFAFGWLSVHGE